ncbi:MAG TPA: hypothetical protein VFO95_03830 [Gemmatimonadales bacterium]|nr:hypothetical protein [Gemmatimonadales bacterium]
MVLMAVRYRANIGPSRNSGAILAMVAAACTVSPPTPTPPVLCAPVSERQPFDPSQLNDLIGDFDLVVVWDQGVARPASRSGRLHLEPSDTLYRYHVQSGVTGQWRRRASGERPLWGWTDAAFEPLEEAGSRDPLAPGVYYDTQEAALYAGSRPLVVDDGFDLLEIRWTVPGGFGGRFTPDLGIAMLIDSLTGREVPQGGYFCARRRDVQTIPSNPSS